MVKIAALLSLMAAVPSAFALKRTQTNPNANPVYGWCDFDWANAHKAQNIQCGVSNRLCNGARVYSELVLYTNNAATQVEKVLARWPTSGGTTSCSHNWDNTKHSWDSLPRSNMAKARVRACVVGGSCYSGNLVDNPYTAGS